MRVNVLDGCRGSSPLTRGKRSRQHRSLFMARLIPAHAGKTHSPDGLASLTRAHPRSRGEKSPLHLTPSEVQGSSPLTRGKLAGAQRRGHRERLIPAHAGKTAAGLSWRLQLQAHPRSRGENREEMSRLQERAGSSPLTRGKRSPSWCTVPALGLIPAHAGKTTRPVHQFPCRWAHPRSRGENQGVGRELGKVEGSSPLTRGKLRPHAEADQAPGLIPAHAGKTQELAATTA